MIKFLLKAFFGSRIASEQFFEARYRVRRDRARARSAIVWIVLAAVLVGSAFFADGPRDMPIVTFHN